jgi:cell wall assembly regulator SMI1
VDYHGLFEIVRRHLERHGVVCDISIGEPASAQELAAVENELGVTLPGELREFYTTVGNGYSMYWNADASNARNPWGSLQVLSLVSLAEVYTGWRGMALYDSEAADRYGFPYTKNPTLAKQTAARQWHWLPVIEEGNGDLICVDLSVSGGPVVFHQHDWLDGGTGDDGHVLAPGWGAFLNGWGSVCFQNPAGLYWPHCFLPGGGVAWDGEEFREPFRVGMPDDRARATMPSGRRSGLEGSG